jgi:O-antigen/teichoic acid export membrane protein
MIPFRNLLRLSAGDFVAKTLFFLATVHIARSVGVEAYGVLEFGLAMLAYFTLLADGGLEMWATRAVARGEDVRALAGRVVPLRFLFALVSFCVLLAFLPFCPNQPGLKLVLILFGLSLFFQAASLKWVFLGKEQMTAAAGGLVIAQLIFCLSAFLFTRSPQHLVLVPLFRLAGDAAMAAYFWRLLRTRHPGGALLVSFRGVGKIVKPAATMALSQALGLMSYNFDAVLMGFLLTSTEVGWYGAAYKPVTVMLAIPLTCFTGLFPALTRAWTQGPAAFNAMVARAARLALLLALPLGIGVTLFADSIIHLLFGPAYAASAPVLRILVWSAVLVIFRGTFRQALNAAGQHGTDLGCAVSASATNVILNLILIPRYGMTGAAAATVASEVLWAALIGIFFVRRIGRARRLEHSYAVSHH